MRQLSARAWWIYLTVFLLALIPYALLPVGLLFGVYFEVLAWSGVLAMAYRLVLSRRRQELGPLWLLVFWAACGATGVLVLTLMDRPPSPGIPDLIFLAGSLAQITGMVWLVRRRVPARNRERLLDSAVISCGYALVVAIFLIKPAVAQAGSIPAAVTLAAYPMSDLFIFALLISLLLSGGLGSRAMRLLAFAQLALLVYDLAYAFIPEFLFQQSVAAGVANAVSVLVYGLLGAAALHPSFTDITSVSSLERRDLPWLRTPLLWAASMTGPGLLAYEAWKYDSRVPDAIVIAVGCTVIFGLVVGRLQVLVSRVNTQSVELAEQADRLVVLASSDGLTGLVNRRTWDDLLVAGLEPGATVALIDIDHFKRYNDTHGHQAGDRLLKTAAAAWSGQMRSHDVLARYGGEEFVVLLPECDAAAATEILGRLRGVTPDGQTFSAGIASWDGRETADELVARADGALYAAKHAGRDRAVVASPGHALSV
ncbi:GGDEF domain-containing protein [Actinoplanes bogorensis]|uniref:GGDEF domain-containing protein n=1 Tax=Paractinoplanes bogorensis TaxID=1610840 RepID=A0ABS5YJF8_9ACTN|nr:GGDEF domain-containing protein [Actinoplanes bogorensis]MBU2663597.1 GGDEF domain-containing protein [Actinoplanes bogorensis]